MALTNPPILVVGMHTQYPDNETKRFFTYRNRGYLQSQLRMRKLVFQEWLRFGWYFPYPNATPPGCGNGFDCGGLGRRERFGRGERSDGKDFRGDGKDNI